MLKINVIFTFWMLRAAFSKAILFLCLHTIRNKQYGAIFSTSYFFCLAALKCQVSNVHLSESATVLRTLQKPNSTKSLFCHNVGTDLLIFHLLLYKDSIYLLSEFSFSVHYPRLISSPTKFPKYGNLLLVVWLHSRKQEKFLVR